jgi:hypothetical protein
VPYAVPDDTQRITIIGKTGSGKTQAAAWSLAQRSFDTRPWIVFDFKHEPLFLEIPHIEEIGLRGKVPRWPGLYVVHPDPSEKEQVEEFLRAIWRREECGVYIDEGYMIPRNSNALEAILTQGRSKEIPVVMLSQRPVAVSRFAFSEADYIQCFQLTDRRDQKTVQEFADLPLDKPLPQRYYSYWWDNAESYKAILKPVPSRDTILNRFYERLVQPKRVTYR